MEFKAKDIAALLKGVVEGDGEVMVNNVSKIEEGKPNTLAFLANPKYEHYIYTTAASVVLVNHDFSPVQQVPCTLIRVPSAYEAIASLLQMYDSMRSRPTGIEQPSYIGEGAVIGEAPYVGAFAYIGKGAKIGNDVKIYPQVYIGEGVVIGDHTTIYAGAKIYYGCVIGSGCTIHAGTVIGADGFGFAPNGDNYNKVPQIGNVVIEDNVEIGANACIDRATMGSTRIKKGVKLDNLVQIAHNVVVGENTVMAAQCGIAGTTKVGAHVCSADRSVLPDISGLKTRRCLPLSPGLRTISPKDPYLWEHLPSMFRNIGNVMCCSENYLNYTGSSGIWKKKYKH